VYVIHAPDPTIPLAETLKGMDEAHRLGFFKRMGLSNFSAAEVEEAYAICKEHGYVLPTVYEGNYSAVARKADTLLLPTLRRLGIAFYAYSPMAGGLLTKTPAQLGERGPGAGRFAGEGFGATMYNALYNKPSYISALDHWAEAAKSVGVTKAELAYRWVVCDSPLSAAHGDAILFGGSTTAQVAEVLAWLKKGSLGADARAKIDEIWQMVEADAPMDNYQSFWKDNSAKILAENPRALGVAPSLSR
jgi:aflatoxin B1 aldehyde reductase